ncbi:MAG: peptide deformylase [Geminicoccaceae bacterium]|nr:MAG: peptide deformylase [Geminicoccaceae bacterium]
MAKLAILHHPDPRLRATAAQVTSFDADLERFVADLIETLHAAGGIGLAATQTGDLRRVFVMDLSPDRTAPEVYVNPEILQKRALGLVEESCLSVPGVVGNVVRATQVRVRAQDVQGATFERDLEAMHAVCVQHEIDHLDGRLFVDRLSILRRLWLKAWPPKAAKPADRAA